MCFRPTQARGSATCQPPEISRSREEGSLGGRRRPADPLDPTRRCQAHPALQGGRAIAHHAAVVVALPNCVTAPTPRMGPGKAAPMTISPLAPLGRGDRSEVGARSPAEALMTLPGRCRRRARRRAAACGTGTSSAVYEQFVRCCGQLPPPACPSWVRWYPSRRSRRWTAYRRTRYRGRPVVARVGALSSLCSEAGSLRRRSPACSPQW